MGVVDDLRSVDAAIAQARRVGAQRVQLAAINAEPGAIELSMRRVAQHCGLRGPPEALHRT